MITRYETKLRNVFESNLATDIKLLRHKYQKILNSGGFLDLLLSKIAGPLMKVAVPMAKSI